MASHTSFLPRAAVLSNVWFHLLVSVKALSQVSRVARALSLALRLAQQAQLSKQMPGRNLALASR